MGNFCLEKCDAICCRSGQYMKMTFEEYETIYNGRGYSQIDKFPDSENRFLFRREGDCEFLRGKMCKIWKKRRPRTCTDFIAQSHGCLKLREYFS